MALNTDHALYANIIRAQREHDYLPTLTDETAGADDLPTQAIHSAYSKLHESLISPYQGIATDGVHWYEINTAQIIKRVFATGAQVAINNTPYTGLPSGVDHFGEGFVDGGLLYIPAVNWDGATETATVQTIAVFNTSDLSLNTQFDVSAQTTFNASALCKSHNGTIYGISFSNSAANDARQSTVHEFNLSTGAFITTHTLSNYSRGSQGITYDGARYLITSYDAVTPNTLIHVYDEALLLFSSIDSTGINKNAVIE